MTKSDDGIQARMPGVPGVVLFDLFSRHFIENKIKRRDIGVIPLLFSFPFMFYPIVLSGDTQLWILSAALIAIPLGFQAILCLPLILRITCFELGITPMMFLSQLGRLICLRS